MQVTSEARKGMIETRFLQLLDFLFFYFCSLRLFFLEQESKKNERQEKLKESEI